MCYSKYKHMSYIFIGKVIAKVSQVTSIHNEQFKL